MHASPDDIDIAAVWQAVRRNGLRLAVAVLVAGAVTYAVLSSMSPLYRSSAQIILSRDESIYTRPRAEQPPAAESLKIDQDEIASQVEVIQSSDALQRIIDELKLDKRPEFNSALRSGGPITTVLRLLGLVDADRKLPERERVFNAFRKNLVVYPVAKSHVIAIEFTSTDPKLAADIANAVATAYIESNRLEQLRRDSDATSWIGSRIEELKSDAETAEAALERFRAQAGLLEGQNNVTLNSQQLSELNSQLTAATTQRSEADARAKEVRAMLEAGEVDASPDVMRSPLIQRLLEQKVATEREAAELSATLLAKHPRMIQVSSKLAKIKTEIRREALKIVKSLEKEAEIARSRQAAIAGSIKEMTEKAEQLSDSQAKLGGLERAAKSKRELYEAYLDRYNEASTRDQRSVSAYARQIAKAMPSSIPDFPRKLPSTLLAMVAMLLAGLGLVVTRELMRAARGGLHRPAGASAQAGAPPSDAMPPPERLHRTPLSVVGSGEELSLGGIVQALSRRVAAAPGQCTIVTAATNRSDVCTASLSIARALAKTGRTVVIVDAGADGSGLAGVARIAGEPGLREVVSGRASFEDVLAVDAESDAHLIPAGSPGLAKALIEAPAQLSLTLEALTEIYDQTILVAAPARLRSLLACLEGQLDLAIEIVGADGATAISALLADQGLEVLRTRVAVRGHGRVIRSEPSRPMPPAAE
ncbi:MAG: exopolysaccharide transport family protein [Hyphomicrobiaceae bacterium]